MFLRNVGLMASAGLATVLAVGSGASAAAVIFDDDYAPGWEGTWRMETQSDNVHSGSVALFNTDNGQFQFDHSGFVDASNHILEFYVNTSDETLASGLQIHLSWKDPDDTLHDGLGFSTTNVSVTYVVDGTPANPPLSLDTDTSSWQKVQLDLTQTVYNDWPYKAHTYVPGDSAITRIMFRSIGGQSNNVLMDSVRLVPEPASLSVLGMGLGALLLRRRR